MAQNHPKEFILRIFRSEKSVIQFLFGNFLQKLQLFKISFEKIFVCRFLSNESGSFSTKTIVQVLLLELCFTKCVILWHKALLKKNVPCGFFDQKKSLIQFLLGSFYQKLPLLKISFEKIFSCRFLPNEIWKVLDKKSIVHLLFFGNMFSQKVKFFIKKFFEKEFILRIFLIKKSLI